MEKFICAFSSDYRELYKADIYKVLAMPKGFVAHFRYKKKYVSDSILNNIENQINKEVIVFFSQGNTLNNQPNNISIRKAKLIKAEVVKETELFHAYLQLGDFCNILIDENNLIEALPSNKFFSLLDFNSEPKEQSWFDKIETLKDYFGDICFYNIKSLKKLSGKVISLAISTDKKGCYYKLIHGKKYIVEMSIANPKQSMCKLKIISSSDDVSANILNPIEITAEYDDITVPIYLKSLNVSTESSFISFIPENGEKINSEYGVNIEIEKKIGIKRAFSFGIFTVLAILSIWTIKEQAKSFLQIGNWDWKIDWILVLSVTTLLISSSILFSEFNKK